MFQSKSGHVVVVISACFKCFIKSFIGIFHVFQLFKVDVAVASTRCVVGDYVKQMLGVSLACFKCFSRLNWML
jgi:phosphoserine phosphatase